MAIKLWENLQLSFGDMIEFDLSQDKILHSYLKSSSGAYFLNKFEPSEKFCCCTFAKFLESAYINLIHILTKFQ